MARHERGGERLKRVCVWLPESLVTQLQADARQRHRSLNRWVTHVLDLTAHPIALAQAQADHDQVEALGLAQHAAVESSE